MPGYVTLRAKEAYGIDVNESIARIDYHTMDELGLSSGYVVEITGKNKTVSKVMPLYPADEGKEMIRMDGLMRENTGVDVGGCVKVRKVKARPAKKLTISIIEDFREIEGMNIAVEFDGVPILKGNKMIAVYFGGRLVFTVVKTFLAGAVTISKNTVIERQT
ncbi:MAG: hypothetical protein JRN26_02910 [Nitrososphaerota archaeon]|jgi:transitional endoplasmic reticulum ATPase|nr:hypothetical protein [Nitrososphaerota archaeon]MDG6928283.1 hypothetical protein [Nitrososphaerota archaeon]MDG6931566.1 hypothetical protein [Nitrososphaerota archaeon]MDG6935825.1 hypothetical protein [Nitrososphaerota archaeon]MDG6943484.1 hypothetical protein [Nitrososphaerota archaeon]